jgi:multiple sugar transport system ATP-binding protein
MAPIGVINVRKAYGAHEVVHGVSIDISDGDFVILVGPSGCGKSTLLRMIAGLESITSGVIKIGNRVVNALAPKDRDIAMVFQNYALYPHKTVAENMGFALKLRHAPKAEIEQRVRRAAEILDVTTLLGRYPRQLSGGQRQRVAMGRAIVRDPQVFLFDEPLSNLDAKLRVQMRAEIKELHQRLKTTTIYVTHDQIEAMTMADRIVVLRDGVVEQVGAPLDLYDRPANLFVASFIGSPSMNLLNGTIRVNGSPTFVVDGGVSLPLASAPPDSDGRRAIYGIRPEHLVLSGTEGMPVEVSVLEPTGQETQVFAKLGGQKIVAVFRQRLNAKPGEMLPMMPEVGLAHLFDKETGARIS